MRQKRRRHFHPGHHILQSHPPTTVEPNMPLYTPAGISPTPSADVLPSTTPTVTPAATSFTLLNKNVSKHVSKKKVQYQIHSYVTDTVALKTSLKATLPPRNIENRKKRTGKMLEKRAVQSTELPDKGDRSRGRANLYRKNPI